ncbi:hypothetical protein TELCIR_12370 [Teladorsagia circumcincta]|uniref:EGF-like calcium-binding domain-containing protein n=1 Tax=Teladorsagia circumcincta TaxID=45464 RepID=A0A2G9U6N9_TELCI|nr:hypothetical protein TELCIR_12370 [Teladorsagia circumcincta]
MLTLKPPLRRKCGNAADKEFCYYENSTEIRVTYTRACMVVRVPQIYKWRLGTDAPAVKNMKESDAKSVVHNFCLDPAPSFCPAGEYDCQMYGFGNYSCNCAAGFYYNVTGKQCVKVGERVNITLYFKHTPYSEIYNNLTHPEAISARKLIQAAFDKIYGINLIKLVFNNFTEGSLVAHLQLMLKLHDTGTFRNNEKIFKDERCGNVVCPEHTECRPIDDIDECASNPCQTEAECLNTPGSYVCARDADNAVHLRFPVIVALENENRALTLILLILACFFLLTTIGAILFAVCQKRRNRTGTYQLYGAPAPDGMSSTKTVQSSWT